MTQAIVVGIQKRETAFANKGHEQGYFNLSSHEKTLRDRRRNQTLPSKGLHLYEKNLWTDIAERDVTGKQSKLYQSEICEIKGRNISSLY